MRTIGIRVSPSSVTYVIYDAQAKSILTVDKINVPKALSVPDSLKFVRSNVLDIIREYEIDKAGIRISETTVHRQSIERIQLEGVIQEALASSSVSKYYCGQISSISARAGIARADFKKYIADELVFDRIPGWTRHSVEEKEAMLTAIGAEHA
jgi:hypothetical protein